MQRTVVNIADRAVATKQISYSDAAIGTMCAAYNLFRLAEHGEQASFVLMRKCVEVMENALRAERDAPRLEV